MHEMGPQGPEHNIFSHRVLSGDATKLYMYSSNPILENM